MVSTTIYQLCFSVQHHNFKNFARNIIYQETNMKGRFLCGFSDYFLADK